VIANAESRAELAASRARVVAAGDEARRRIERDLHDGAQARMVSTVMALKLARQALGDATGPAVELVDEALAQAEGANGELHIESPPGDGTVIAATIPIPASQPA
jgi:signal transduction histidine kinase